MDLSSSPWGADIYDGGGGDGGGSSSPNNRYEDLGLVDSVGPGENDSAYQYYTKHVPPQASNTKWTRPPILKGGSIPTPITGGVIPTLREIRDEPVEMTCMHCRYGNCMYVPNETASSNNRDGGGQEGGECVGPYCADCNRAVLAAGSQELKRDT
jgi:hypothetical protein